MKAELWKKIDALFAAAQAQPAEQRAAFLDRACEGDQELRAEVESLLRAATSDKSFLGHPPTALPGRPALQPGGKLGAFEIVERIGRGGMGEVYRARDPRLKRDVAIKVLPPEFAEDPGRLRRFEHEARMASALNHPNIVAVYDIGGTDGISWIVTELVEGRPLREMLAKDALPPRKAVEIAAQIAEGLAAAHAAGLVHRDLKAENVMLAPNDLVKILDFGIAKRTVEHAATDTAATTVTSNLTKTGEVVGTPASMSPEQALGKEMDHRSDIFSLGVLLYEMLSGKRPFAGDSRVAVMHAIVNQEPEDLPAAVPEGIAGIVQRCLEKPPDRRFQSAADLAFALRALGGAQVHPAVERSRRRTRWPIRALAVAALVLAGGGSFWLAWRITSRAAVFHGTMRRLTWDGGLTTNAVISADGKLVAYASDRDSGSNLDIYVQQVDSGGVVRLTKDPAEHDFPTFTPDGSRVAFDVSGKGIYEAPALGGEPRLLVAGGSDPQFSPDGQYLLYASGVIALRRVAIEIAELRVQPLAGGNPILISPGCTDISDVMWSPDSKHVFFSGYCSGTPGFWLADADGRAVRRVNTAAGLEQLPWAGSQWLAKPSQLLGYAWFGDASHLVEMPISADGGKIAGPTQLVTFGPGVIASASAASGGRTVFTSRESGSTLWRLAIDAAGRAQGDPVEIRTGWSACWSPRLSKDGRNLAYVAVHMVGMVGHETSSESEVRVMDLVTGITTPVARTSAYLDLPVFNAAGDRLTFTDFSKPGGRVMEISIHGGAVTEFPLPNGPDDWSADGSFYVTESGFPGPTAVTAVDRKSRKATRVLADPERSLWQAHPSPDGRWVTFNAVGNNQSRIYIAPFRLASVPANEWIPLTDGDSWDDKPRLSSDGRILFFLSDRDGHRCLWRQPLKPDMHPNGPPEPVYHFHSSRPSFLAVDLNNLELTVGPRYLVFNLGEARGNIWMLDPLPGTRRQER